MYLHCTEALFTLNKRWKIKLHRCRDDIVESIGKLKAFTSRCKKFNEVTDYKGEEGLFWFFLCCLTLKKKSS